MDLYTKEIYKLEEIVDSTKKKWYQILLSNKMGMLGLGIILFFIIVSVFAPYIASNSIFEMNYESALLPPSSSYIFGTDEFGRDLFSRILFGGRVSLMMGATVVFFAGTIGVLLGLISGYFERLDKYIMRIIDILMALPSLLLAIVIVAILGVGLKNAMIAVAISAIPTFVRVIRSEVLSLKKTEFVEASTLLGVSKFSILMGHILPNVLPTIIVLCTLEFGSAILSAAALSFLGIGAQPPNPEWGALVFVGKSYLTQAWWLTVIPGLCIMLVVLGFNLLGDALRDSLDPKDE